MPTLKQQICSLLESKSGLSDRELTNELRGSNSYVQPVNQACRQLEKAGVIERKLGAKGITNVLTGRALAQPKSTPDDAPLITEDDVKRGVAAWLEYRGWKVKVAWGRERGIDIDARKGTARLLIEAKGSSTLYQAQRNFFYGVIGDIAQKMDDADCGYALAIPDTAHHRGMWARLPELAKARLELACFFVSKAGNVEFHQGGSNSNFG